MTISKNRGGFTLVELLVVIAIIGTLVGLLLPAVQQAREAARRSSCTNGMKQLGLALLNFESSRKRLPSASDRATGASNPGSGHSWVTMCLPFMEEVNLYNNMSNETARFSNGTGSVTSTNSTSLLKQLICASFAGDTTQPLTCYKAISAVGYSSNIPTSTASGAGAITLQYWENTRQVGGVNVPGPYAGLSLAQISDGTSKTFSLAETKQNSTTWNHWIRGDLAWVTGAKGDGTFDATNRRWTAGSVALLEQVAATPGWVGYATLTAGANAVGPSSYHTGGITIHGYVDGHVGQVNNEIDMNTYFSLISRGDGEAISGDAP